MINNSLLDNVAITMTPAASQHVMAAAHKWALARPRGDWCDVAAPSLARTEMPGPASRTRDSRPRRPSVCRLAACPPGPGHQFVGIRARAGLHPQTGHHGVWSPRFVPFPSIHIIHSWCLPRPPGGCQQITKVWVILYCIPARTVCSQLRLARSRLSLWEDKLGLQSSKQQTPAEPI